MWPSGSQVDPLLEQARQGQPGAVEKLLRQHRDALRQLIHWRLDRAVAARVDASDVVQDVMLEASQRLADYLQSPPMPFGAWLRRLAQDRLIDMHRKHRQAERRSVDREQSLKGTNNHGSSFEGLVQLADGDLTPAAAALRREFQVRFLEALDQLNQDDQQILKLRHLDQLSNSEVADQLELSPPAAGMRYLRALRRLRKVLGEDNEPSTAPT